jgi:hypothetical protein
MFSMNFYFMSTRDLPELSPTFQVLMGPGVIAVFWLWIWMLTDYFRERPPIRPVLWGWLLVLGSYAGALAYFFAIWRGRHRPT